MQFCMLALIGPSDHVKLNYDDYKVDKEMDVQVIVVDVEDRDDSVWHNLTPFDGGLSGWRLLWDRWCPIPRFRSIP